MKSVPQKVARLSSLAAVTISLVLGQLAFAPSANAVEHVLDGGFEAAGPAGDSPSWTEADSVFDTPLCNASCGGVGPHAGAWWSWFGGTTDVQTASLSQSVTIPAGAASASLSFWLFISNAPAPNTASLTVKMDSTTITTFTPTTTDADYVLRTFDVSSFADGTAHTLLFSYDNPSVTATPPNFHMDDVSINSVDSTAPETTITSSPTGGVAKSLSVPISFTSSEPGSTFSCTLDTGAAANCSSPTTLTVTPGQHTFKVAAKDASNNVDATPASVTFTAYDCPTLTAAVTAAQAKVDAAAKKVSKAKKALKKAKKSGDATKVAKAKKKLKKAKAAAKAAKADLATAQGAAAPCGTSPKLMAERTAERK